MYLLILLQLFLEGLLNYNKFAVITAGMCGKFADEMKSEAVLQCLLQKIQK